MTPLDVISGALEDLCVIPAGGTPGGGILTLGLRHYNRMVEYLAAQRLGWYEVNEAFTFSASQQSYTIGKAGSGANFIMTAGGERPPKFDRAKLVLTAGSPDTEIVLPIYTVQEYSAIAQPAQSAAEPGVIYYVPDFPNGKLFPVPYPTTTTNQLRLYWKNQLATVLVAAISTDIPVPPGVQDALTWELLRRCAPAFGWTLTADQLAMANSSWQVLITMKNADPGYISTNTRGAEYQHGRNTFNPNTLRGY
jgi:hypothetical protein